MPPQDDHQYRARFRSLDATRRMMVEAYGAVEHLPPDTPLASILRGQNVVAYLNRREIRTIDDVMRSSVQQLATMSMFTANHFRTILRATMAPPRNTKAA